MDMQFDLLEQNDKRFSAYSIPSYKAKETPSKIMFSIEEPEFDTSTYMGRFMRNRLICNPLIAFYSNKKISEMKQMVDRQKAREEEAFKRTGDRQVMTSVEHIKNLRRAQTVLRTAIHPDTGEFIPWPMRMSSFTLVNLPISWGMIIAAPTPINTIFWQWVNQTYNATINYGNRNASSTNTSKDIMQSYMCACAASISVSLVIRKYFEQRAKLLKGSKLIVLNSVSTMFAVATAGYLNAYLMRKSELKTGIDIYDPEEPNKSVGRSVAAAQMAVSQTAFSRCLFAVPIMFPAFVLYGLERASMMPQGRGLRTMLQMSLFYMKLSIAVPLGTAFYPQVGQIDATQIEPRLMEELEARNGGNVPKYYLYNKGL